MAILKHKTDTNYTKISTSMLQTSNLSLKAKGLLCYMLSCVDNWKFSIVGLSTACGESKYTIEQALNELAEHGYHKKVLAKDNGKFKEWEYWVSDSPDFEIPNQTDLPLIITKDNNNHIKEKKKEKKANLYKTCADIIEDKFKDDDIKAKLFNYLKFRITVGLSAEQWRSITEELFSIATTKDEVLKIIDMSYKNNWRSFFPLKKTYSTNGYVDNIKDTELTDDGKLKERYREEFMMTPVSERPKFQDWLEGLNNA